MQKDIARLLNEHKDIICEVQTKLTTKIESLIDVITHALSAGKKILIMGNGGSAADAQHFAAEIVGRFKVERPAWPAIALTTDTSLLTAIGNDYCFNEIFSRQVEALATDGDIVIGISTSGKSGNVLLGLQAAKRKGAVTVGLLGQTGGEIAEIVDTALIVPSDNTARVQEAHITIIHIICELVESGLSKSLP